MKDNLSPPSLRVVAKEYNARDFEALIRDIERYLVQLREKGPVNVSDLLADNATISGTTTGTFAGDGSALTDLNATQLTTGTVPDGRFPATLPAVSGVNLTNLNASNLASGTVNDARLPTTQTGKTFTGAVEVNANIPTYKLYEADQAVDNRWWNITSASSSFRVQALTDAGSGGGNVFDITRSAEQISQFRFGNVTTPWVTMASGLTHSEPNFTSNGNVSAKGGQLNTWAATASTNAHVYWRDDTGTQRGLWYWSFSTGKMFLQIYDSGGAAQGSTINYDGTVLDITAGQLKFPATQNASSNANTLDDYAEGTFTPTISFGGGSTGVTYNGATTTGRYTKVGRLVICGGRLQLTNKGSSTGAAVLGGLPFNTAGTHNIVIGRYANFTGLTGVPIGYLSGSTNVQLMQTGAASSANLTDAEFTNTTDIGFSVLYSV